MSGGVVLPCALSCDCGVFSMCLADGVMVCAFVSCVLYAVDVVCVGLRCCLLFGVRMARTGFKCIDIYLYTDGVSLACGVFSCSCGGLWCWLVVCVWMYQGFVPCGDGGVMVYICIYVYNALVACVGGGVVVFCSCVYG